MKLEPKPATIQSPGPGLWMFGFLGVLLLAVSMHAVELLKGGAKQLQLAQSPMSEVQSLLPMDVGLPTETNRYTLKWLGFDYETNTTVTNFIVFVGTNSGSFGQNFNIGNTNRFALGNLIYGQEYYVCVKAQSADDVSLPSEEFHWPPPQPPLEIYVLRTLQYSNQVTGVWENKFSTTETNPIGNRFYRLRVGGPVGTPSATTKSQQSATSPNGLWSDIPGTVGALTGTAAAHPLGRFTITSWNNQINYSQYQFPEP